jgi:hypothetical protein
MSIGGPWGAVVGGHRVRIFPGAMQGRVESVTGSAAIEAPA